MKWCRIELDGKPTFGLVEGDEVAVVDGSPFGGGYTVTKTRVPFATAKLLVPTVPSNFFAAGVNYMDHVIKMAAQRGTAPNVPPKPDIGYRSNNALLPHGGDIVKPKDSTELFQYEGELVAVFGKTIRNVSKDEALDAVLGWTIGNDVSERTWQRSDRTFWRGKNADTFKPMGPWIETDITPDDLQAMVTVVRLNGREVERFRTANMIFDPATYISAVSQYCTISAGDVMWMGADGVPENMKPGDTVEVEITGLGILRNRVVAGE